MWQRYRERKNIPNRNCSKKSFLGSKSKTTVARTLVNGTKKTYSVMITILTELLSTDQLITINYALRSL